LTSNSRSDVSGRESRDEFNALKLIQETVNSDRQTYDDLNYTRQHVGAKRARFPEQHERYTKKTDEITTEAYRVRKQSGNIGYNHSGEDNKAQASTLKVRCQKTASHQQSLSDSSPFASLLSAVAIVTSCDDHDCRVSAQLKQSSIMMNDTMKKISDASVFDHSVGSGNNSKIYPKQ
jgi:hypothetical protein